MASQEKQNSICFVTTDDLCCREIKNREKEKQYWNVRGAAIIGANSLREYGSREFSHGCHYTHRVRVIG